MRAQGAVESYVSSSGPSLSQQPHRTAHTQRTSSRYVLRLRVSVVSRLEIACRNLPSQSFHRQHLDLRSNEAGRPEDGLVSSLSLVCALGRVACEAARRRGREGLEARRLSRSTVLSRSCRCLRGRVYYIYSTSRPPRRGGDDHLQEKGSGLTLSANTADHTGNAHGCRPERPQVDAGELLAAYGRLRMEATLAAKARCRTNTRLGASRRGALSTVYFILALRSVDRQRF